MQIKKLIFRKIILFRKSMVSKLFILALIDMDRDQAFFFLTLSQEFLTSDFENSRVVFLDLKILDFKSRILTSDFENYLTV